MLAVVPEKISRRVILCALALVWAGDVTARQVPDPTPDCQVARAIEIWKEGTAAAKLRALDRLARRGELAVVAVPLLIPALGDPDARVRARVAVVLGDIGPAAERAVPALTAALDNADDDVCESAARALGAIGGSARAAVPSLVHGLRSSALKRRRGAAAALAGIGDPAVPALLNLLKCDEPRMRSVAADALAKMIPMRVSVIPAVIDAVLISTHDDRTAILAALEQFGTDAVVGLAVALREADDSDVVRRASLVQLLGYFGPSAERAVPRLVGLLENRDLRFDAADAVSLIAPEGRDDLRVFLVALKAKGVTSRARAAMVLGRIGETQKELAARVVRYLIPATNDSDSRVRAIAVRSIGKIAALDDDKFRMMCRKLDDPAPDVKVAALESLAGCGRRSESIRLRAALLTSPDSCVRVAAAESMNGDDVESSLIVTGLVELLGDADAKARAAAAVKLREFRQRLRRLDRSHSGSATGATYETFRKHLRDTEPKVRAAMARLLPEFERRIADSIPELSHCLKDESAIVRCAAVKSIADLGPAANETVPALLDLLGDGGDEGTDGVTASTLAAGTLEAMVDEGEALVVRRLVEMLGSADPLRRRQASLRLQDLDGQAVEPLSAALRDPKTPRLIKAGILEVLTAKDESEQSVRKYSRTQFPGLCQCLPALQAMLNDDDALIRRRAFRVIGSIATAPEVRAQSFVAAARVQDPAEMECLNGLLKPADIQPLLASLADADPDVRTSIVYALANIVCRMSQPDDRADQETRANASLALAAAVFDSERLRKEIVHALVPLLDDPDSQVRWAAIHGFESLGNLNDPALLDRLIRIARDSTTRVRRGATIYRQDLRNGDSICFRKATQERLRLAAIDCLATIDGWPNEVASVMIEAVADGDPLTRLHALCTLGNCGRPDKAVVPVLIDLLHGDGAPKNDAGRACFELDEHSVPIKLAALALLGQIGRESTAAIPDLVDLFADPVAEVRERSAGVLGLIGPEAASCVPALIRQIEREQIDFGAGKTAVEAIGLSAQAALIGMISNRSLPIVDRIGAVDVLASLGAEADDAIPILKELLVTAEPALRRAIERAIRAIEVGSRASKFGSDE